MKNVMRLSTKEILDMVSPVWSNAVRVRQAIGVHRGISKYARELNEAKHGYFFRSVQDMAIDTMVISTCKIYDTSNKKYKKHTIPELASFLSKNISNARIRNPHLLKQLEVEGLDDIKTKVPSQKNSSCLKSLFAWRDKVIAHQENFSNNDKIQKKLKDFPAIEEIEKINNWSFGFCELFVDVFTDDTMLDVTGDESRIATLNVIIKALNKELGNINEMMEFYS